MQTGKTRDGIGWKWVLGDGELGLNILTVDSCSDCATAVRLFEELAIPVEIVHSGNGHPFDGDEFGKPELPLLMRPDESNPYRAQASSLWEIVQFLHLFEYERVPPALESASVQLEMI